MRQISKRLLILCEDEKSSLLYLESFKKDEKLKRALAAVSIEIYQPSDYSPLGLVEEARKKQKKEKAKRNPYDEIWLVLDRDRHANLGEMMNKVNPKKIKVALSIICFEYWVLLHFEKTTKAFENCSKLIKHLQKDFFPGYEKCSNCYEPLKDKIPVALENGEWLDKQVKPDLDRGVKVYELSAYTNMHHLVKKLVNPGEFLKIK